MSKYTAEDFKFEEDYIISAECEDCGYYTENDDDFDYNCPKCGGNLIKETSHESCKCEFCDCYIDMWEDMYRHRKDYKILICKKCYEILENEEENIVSFSTLSDHIKQECENCKHYWMNKGSGVNPDDICYGKNDCRSCKVPANYAWKFEPN